MVAASNRTSVQWYISVEQIILDLHRLRNSAFLCQRQSSFIYLVYFANMSVMSHESLALHVTVSVSNNLLVTRISLKFLGLWSRDAQMATDFTDEEKKTILLYSIALKQQQQFMMSDTETNFFYSSSPFFLFFYQCQLQPYIVT